MEKTTLRFYPECQFGGFARTDGVVAFYCRVNALLNSESLVVDFGCGRGEYANDPVLYRRSLRVLKGRVAKVIGLDVDPSGMGNPAIDEFRKLEAGLPWPVESRSADLIICDNVVEHLPDPGTMFREAKRVLRRRGFLCVRTTNLLSYVGLAAKLIPNRHHGRVLGKVQDSRPEEDVFPTLYRCNTVRSLRRAMDSNGFLAAVYGHDAEPLYLTLSTFAYACGVLHQKVMPAMFAQTIFAFGQSVT
jgi:SAM-dependent methyltransferase